MTRVASRILAVSLLGLVVASAAALALSYADHISDLRDQISQQRRLKSGLMAHVAQQPEELAVESKAQLESFAAMFLTASSDSIQSAAVQTRLTGLARKSALKIRSLRNLAPKTQNALRLVGVELEFYATPENVQAYLYDIEQSKPAMVVQTLNVSPVPGGVIGSDQVKPGMLSVKLAVFCAAMQNKG